ncbi:hypothetical protein P691DRAFT_759129 [Macrolepiota fuliginosa MF-IS2]|uniref:Uncharacterized protein n=1 Tax=Macrolepiota fuliginosa MF-IS2 TaxID=1400762 RepID=A0A9P6C516_9AGAR|nr:hypothetical protein P691DRAFT_759129 [Macrolepiota fuliginosa MF-IS2]
MNEQQAAFPPIQSVSRDELLGSPIGESTIDHIALGDRVPFMLQSREMAGYVATMSPA